VVSAGIFPYTGINRTLNLSENKQLCQGVVTKFAKIFRNLRYFSIKQPHGAKSASPAGYYGSGTGYY